ncbi:MAG: NADH-quinone oxidoreductase subunit NuoE [Desulfuromonadaceae bacterium]|nr:NADH-quinone oxidoreductase subunit NuoE [Desulfuromonadaceae bacterium]
MIPTELKTKLQSRVSAAITNREAAVDVMKALQAHYGWLTDEAVVEAAELLGLSPLQVEELATFYEMIYRRPVGRSVIHVCDSISCWAMGGESLLSHLSGLLGIKPGETTTDGTFTLLPCCCLGNCGEAPAVMIGDTICGRVTVENAAGLIERERNR